jgi:hypothetical protein
MVATDLHSLTEVPGPALPADAAVHAVPQGLAVRSRQRQTPQPVSSIVLR